MPLISRIAPWFGTVYRHLPSGVTKNADVLDFRYAGRASDNRWNVKGNPTLYLAGDIGVALAEWARHFVENTNPALARVPVKRIVWQLQFTISQVLDMRDSEAWEDIGPRNAPHCFLDLATSQTVGTYPRRITNAQALLVPSVALLDKLDRWNLVLFPDKLPPDPRAFISRVERAGILQAPTGLSG
jgi:RES domain-containing protein